MKKAGIALLSSIGFIALVIFISSQYMTDEALTHNGHIPDNIAAYYLVTEIENEEAKEIVDKIHGRAADIDYSYVLEYRTSGEAYAVVWISEFKESDIAKEVYETVEANAQIEKREISDRPVLQQQSEEGKNFYFVNGNRFVVVKTYEEKRELFIKNAVKIF